MIEQTTESGQTWYFISDILRALGENTSNVTTWVRAINRVMPDNAIKVQRTREGYKGEVLSWFCTLQGLYYICMKIKGSAKWKVELTQTCAVPIPIDLGNCDIQTDGEQVWYRLSHVVGSIKDKGIGTGISGHADRLPVQFKRKFNPKSPEGRVLVSTWYVSRQGVIYYLLTANGPRCEKFKIDVCKSLGIKNHAILD